MNVEQIHKPYSVGKADDFLRSSVQSPLKICDMFALSRTECLHYQQLGCNHTMAHSFSDFG